MSPEEKAKICDEILDRLAKLSKDDELDDANIFLLLGALENDTMALKLLYKQSMPRKTRIDR